MSSVMVNVLHSLQHAPGILWTRVESGLAYHACYSVGGQRAKLKLTPHALLALMGGATEPGHPLARRASRTLPNAPQIDRRLQCRSPCKRTSGHTQQRTCTTPPPPRRRHHCRRPGRQTALVVPHRNHQCNQELCLGGAPLHVATVVNASSARSGVRASRAPPITW